MHTTGTELASPRDLRWTGHECATPNGRGAGSRRGGRPAHSELSTLHHVDANRRLITVAELDAMTPNERAATVGAHIVTDLAELPASFRDRVVATGHRLTAERKPAEAG